jgi:hypothetical protein
MRRLIVDVVFLVIWLCLTPDAGAGGVKPSQQESEQLPPPKQVALPVPFWVLPPRPPRLDTRAGWSMFAPDQGGRWRPRVTLAPGGSYYLYSGAPYPWSPQPRQVMPWTSD